MQAELFSGLKPLGFCPGGVSVPGEVVLWVCEESPALVRAAGAGMVTEPSPEQGNKGALGL